MIDRAKWLRGKPSKLLDESRSTYGSCQASRRRCDEGSWWNPWPERCVWGRMDPTGFAEGYIYGWGSDCSIEQDVCDPEVAA